MLKTLINYDIRLQKNKVKIICLLYSINLADNDSAAEKKMTSEGDIILIYFEGKPLSFARIEEILPNSKPSWYHVKLLMLQVPVHTITWILRDSYINGAEFTMNGKKIRIEQVECPDNQNDQKAPQAQNNEGEVLEKTKELEKAKVIHFADIKKK